MEVRKFRTIAIASTAAATLIVISRATLSAETEDPAKFKYETIPVTASCLDGYHPTIDPKWGPVFPCIANAEIVAPVRSGPAVKVILPAAR
jgi:hypothetical protein